MSLNLVTMIWYCSLLEVTYFQYIGTSKLFASFKYRMQRYAGSDDEKRYLADRLLSGRHFSREDGGADVRALADSSDVDHQDCCRL